MVTCGICCVLKSLAPNSHGQEKCKLHVYSESFTANIHKVKIKVHKTFLLTDRDFGMSGFALLKCFTPQLHLQELQKYNST